MELVLVGVVVSLCVVAHCVHPHNGHHNARYAPHPHPHTIPYTYETNALMTMGAHAAGGTAL